MRNKRKAALLAGVLGVVLGVGLVSGCAPTAGSTTTDSAKAAEQRTPQPAVTGLGAVVAAPDKPEFIQANRTATLPEVATDDEGVQYQRTPSEYPESKAYYWPQETLDGSYAYNIMSLDADNRGCNACHEDLGETIQMLGYPHLDLRNEYGIEVTVDMCIDCHSYQPLIKNENEAYSFKEIIHGIHSRNANGFEGDCWSCHVQHGDNEEMLLWDDAKYDVMRGVVGVPELTGQFNWTQDKVVGKEYFYEFPWFANEGDYTRYEQQQNNTPIDEALFDDWTITISGAVDKETTFRLGDLVAEGLGEDIALTAICTANPLGGPLVGNYSVKAIPVEVLFERAGVPDSATGFWTLDARDGGYGYQTSMEDFEAEGHGGYLVYELDGERLSWRDGYPVAYWAKGSGSAGNNTKQISDIVITDEPLDVSPVVGNPTEEGWLAGEQGVEWDDGKYFYNKPNVGIFNNRAGRIVKLGDSITFEGYADAYEEDIVSVELSLDGKNWTSYETPGAKSANWVAWDYTFTPEQVGAYVLRVKATSSSGMQTADTVMCMVNVKDDALLNSEED